MTTVSLAGAPRLTASRPRRHHGPMGAPSRLLSLTLRALALTLPLLAAAPRAEPAELTAFISGASPGEAWGRGYGGLLTITLFNICTPPATI